MTVMDFPSPSMRAAGGDLAMQISPLGIVELSDEEFEVHGQRMVRYANAAAFYLGHHWAYRKPPGEPQGTYNFIKALVDWMTNFCFAKEVAFQVDREFQHIIPALLDRVFSRDNNKQKFMWEVGQMGGIFGDVFVKVAYEDAWVDAATGIITPGKVRLVPLNPAQCFPRWHPHDRHRLEEFKQKYKFWSTAPDGTRALRTYTEIITPTEIKEYVDNELVRDTPNPLGTVPVVHICNTIAPSSPWGLSDIWDSIPLNRQFNELMADISEILAYYAAPITVITGGKPPNLTRGANKVWGIQNEKARVENLSGGFEGLGPAIEILDKLKGWMHEMTGVPVTALGQEQEISNTSGVALAIQYMPATQRYEMKKVTYGEGLKEICKLALMTLFLKEPDAVYYNPDTDGIMEDGQQPYVNPLDPAIYDVDIEWPNPLPVEVLVELDAIERKIALGLTSKRGALRDLGNEFPDEVLEELFEEQLDDIKREGSMQILKSAIAAYIMELTGIVPEGAGDQVEPEPPPTQNADGTTRPAPQRPEPAMDVSSYVKDFVEGGGRNLMGDIVTRAIKPRVPLRRNVNRNDDQAWTT